MARFSCDYTLYAFSLIRTYLSPLLVGYIKFGPAGDCLPVLTDAVLLGLLPGAVAAIRHRRWRSYRPTTDHAADHDHPGGAGSSGTDSHGTTAVSAVP